MVTVNGRPREMPADATVGALVTELVAPPDGAEPGRGVAVALNGEVLPRVDWPATTLRAGDRVEVLTAKQGG